IFRKELHILGVGWQAGHWGRNTGVIGRRRNADLRWRTGRNVMLAQGHDGPAGAIPIAHGVADRAFDIFELLATTLETEMQRNRIARLRLAGTGGWIAPFRRRRAGGERAGAIFEKVGAAGIDQIVAAI